jgi:23S rRNA (uracil1939-C5)-methyltransferase
VSLILRIEKIVYPGRPMAREEGKVVFTDRGLPGEAVEVEVVRDRKSFAEGRTLRIVETSADRVEPRCPHFLACSPYQDIAYEAQLAIKKSQVEEILARALRTDVPSVSAIPSPEIWGYRNRIDLRVIREAGRARLAYHEPGQEGRFVPVDACYLVSDRTNALLAELVAFIDAERWETVAEVEVRESRGRQRSLVVLHLESEARVDEMTGKLSGLHTRFPLSGIVGLVRQGSRITEERLGGVARLEEAVGGIRYRIGPRSFFQVNVGILDRVFEDMAEASAAHAGTGLADLYCGLGTFGLFLAGRAREVFGVEADPANIAYLKKNLALNGVGNFTICEGTSEEWLPWILEREIGIVILDPPRRGAEAGMLRELTARPVPLIMYLSCNPTTLARDLQILREAYVLRDVHVYDFFPHTPHIETLAVLVK